jgi:hypothetical protein
MLPICTLPRFFDETDIIVPIDITNITSPYFTGSQMCSNFAPFLNCLLTPFAMKSVDPYNYVSSIVPNGKKLFNVAFTLPVIDSALNLSPTTNIFRFE